MRRVRTEGQDVIVVELGLGVAGILLSVLTYVLGVGSGKRSERAIRDDVAAVPHRTAEVVTSMLDSVTRPPRPDDPDRGWNFQIPATFGFAPVLPDTDQNAYLVEFPVGAHSATLLALDHGEGELELRGSISNGTGARFHVRESSDGSSHEVVTLDYVRPLREDRGLANMPTQTVYYRMTGSGFVEVGRGDEFDPVDAPWAIPRAVEPFLDPAWLREHQA
jgi:hypothetical protein